MFYTPSAGTVDRATEAHHAAKREKGWQETKRLLEEGQAIPKRAPKYPGGIKPDAKPSGEEITKKLQGVKTLQSGVDKYSDEELLKYLGQGSRDIGMIKQMLKETPSEDEEMREKAFSVLDKVKKSKKKISNELNKRREKTYYPQDRRYVPHAIKLRAAKQRRDYISQ
jgi:hypothetical protein